MTARRFALAMTVVGATWLIALTGAVLLVGVRSENTRSVSAACHRALQPEASRADIERCIQVSTAGVNLRGIETDCTIQRRTLTTGWYERITRCPPLDRSALPPALDAGD